MQTEEEFIREIGQLLATELSLAITGTRVLHAVGDTYETYSKVLDDTGFLGFIIKRGHQLTDSITDTIKQIDRLRTKDISLEIKLNKSMFARFIEKINRTIISLGRHRWVFEPTTTNDPDSLAWKIISEDSQIKEPLKNHNKIFSIIEGTDITRTNISYSTDRVELEYNDPSDRWNGTTKLDIVAPGYTISGHIYTNGSNYKSITVGHVPLKEPISIFIHQFKKYKLFEPDEIFPDELKEYLSSGQYPNRHLVIKTDTEKKYRIDTAYLNANSKLAKWLNNMLHAEMSYAGIQ